MHRFSEVDINKITFMGMLDEHTSGQKLLIVYINLCICALHGYLVILHPKKIEKLKQLKRYIFMIFLVFG